ncbi:MAG: ABC transporter ATP-binding protein [Terriglobales bacterium]
MNITARTTLTAKFQRLLLLRRILRLVWQSAPVATVLRLVLLVLQAVFPLALLYLMKVMVDTVTANLHSPNKDFGHLFWLIIALAGVTLASALCGSLAAFLSEVQGLSVTDHVQSLLHVKSVMADLAHYENTQYYDAMHRAQQEAHYRPMRIVNGLTQLAQSGLALVALAGLLFSLHWMIAVVLIAAAVPGTLARLKYSQLLYVWQRQRTPMERQAWYFESILTGEAHAKEVRLFGLGELFIRRYRGLRETLRRERLRLTARRALADLVTQFAGAFAVFGALAYLARQTMLGAITLGGLVMYYQAFQTGQSYLREILGGLADLYEDSLFLTNYYEFLELQPRIVSPPSPRPLPQPMQRGIVFNHVRFSYDGCERPVLNDITLTIHPGEHIAFVGLNGAGKTTLIKLLCRLYDPTAGNITLDGIDLREFDLALWRQQISVLFQDYARYYLTARENIWLGNVLLAPDHDRIVTAAQAAGADRVIGKLPHGYDTRLGKLLHDEQELSIGEWQKIALARTFIRDAQIVVLDEPTSALDAFAEREVVEKFRQLAADRTTILISHRFSTVRMADRIFVLENGGIAESGSHDELMRQGGEYARMFESQALTYS